MNFTFGIISGKERPGDIDKIIDSIEQIKNLTKNRYEILIIGGNQTPYRLNTKMIEFEDHPRGMWITKQKNIIAKEAQFENIVFLHDYITFDSDWYWGFQLFGFHTTFDVCMTPMLNVDGTRYRDWVWLNSLSEGPPRWVRYSDNSLTRQMYISGAYWIAKKQFMLDNPLDENRMWGESEDVEWSFRCRDTWNYKLNPYSIVKLLKYKDTHCVGGQ